MILRALSGSVIVALILFCIFSHAPLFLWFWFFVTAIAFLEGFRLSIYSRNLRRIYVGCSALWLFCVTEAAYNGEPSHFVVLPLACFAIFLFLCIFLYRGEEEPHFFTDFCALFTTFTYVGLFYTPLFYISTLTEKVPILLFLFGLMWIQDTFAYFGGKLFGRKKLSPYLSPKKTWEGSIIGLIFAYFLMKPFAEYFQTFVQSNLLLVILITGVAGQIGDLLESFFKRNFGVKDSGRILPGHGGILDRFDSVSAGSIVYLAALALASKTP